MPADALAPPRANAANSKKAGGRRPITWDLAASKPKRKASGAAGLPPPTTLDIGGDGEWRLVGQCGAAFGQQMARSCARSIRAAVCSTGGDGGRGGGGTAGAAERPWSVRGEVPLDDQRSACGCTTIVFGGVRMQMPDKVFGNNWLELQHLASGIAFAFDCAGALERWAELSRELIDDRRAGKPGVWSGWTADLSQLHHAWQNSYWGAISSYSRREEWDWTFRTDFAGVASRGPRAAGACARRAAELQEHVLIRAARTTAPAPLGATGGGGDGAAAADEQTCEALSWERCDEAAFAAAEGAAEEWASSEKLVERSCKLYEDNLSELGTSVASVRFREFEHGWEVRVRWWSCLNPGLLPQRGVPHARLREATIRHRFGAPFATKSTEERRLDLTPAHLEAWEGRQILDADCMREHMPLLMGDSGGGSDGGGERGRVTHLMRLHGAARGDGAAGAGAPADVAAAPIPFRFTSALVEGGGGDGGGAAARHVAPAPLTAAVAHPSAGVVAVACADSDEVAALRDGALLWTARHAGVEDLAVTGGALVLSSGEDGCVRAWRLLDGVSAGHVEIRSGVGADRAPGGACVVQCVAAAAAAAVTAATVAAAACGATVLTLHVQSGDEEGTAADQRLTSATQRPPLPSAVASLRFVVGDGRHSERARASSLVAGTLHSGVFVWSGAQLEAAAAAASRWLECKSSVEMAMPLVWPSGHAEVLSRCRDRTIRLWELPKERDVHDNDGDCDGNDHGSGAAGGSAGARWVAMRPRMAPTAVGAAAEAPASPLLDDAPTVVPMTFGGLTGNVHGGLQAAAVSGCNGHAFDDGSCVLAIADGAGGLVGWHLADPKATSPGSRLPSCDVSAGEHAVSEGDGAVTAGGAGLASDMGVDSRRASRLVLPAGRQVLCVAPRPPRSAVLACGCDDGSVALVGVGRGAVLELLEIVQLEVAATSAAAVPPLPPTAPAPAVSLLGGAARVGAFSSSSRRAPRPAACVKHLVWSSDGRHLYATVGARVHCVDAASMAFSTA